MTKRWHTVKDYCADPSGYEAHRRTRLSEAYAKELAGLRRQVAELAAALESVEWLKGFYGNFFCPRCGGEKGFGHRDDCQLERALTNTAPDNGDSEEAHG